MFSVLLRCKEGAAIIPEHVYSDKEKATLAADALYAQAECLGTRLTDLCYSVLEDCAKWVHQTPVVDNILPELKGGVRTSASNTWSARCNI